MLSNLCLTSLILQNVLLLHFILANNLNIFLVEYMFVLFFYNRKILTTCKSIFQKKNVIELIKFILLY